MDDTEAGSLAERYDAVTLGMSGGVGLGIELGEGELTVEILQHRDLIPPVEGLRNLATAVSVGVKR
jgi:hypothetical protein